MKLKQTQPSTHHAFCGEVGAKKSKRVARMIAKGQKERRRGA